MTDFAAHGPQAAKGAVEAPVPTARPSGAQGAKESDSGHVLRAPLPQAEGATSELEPLIPPGQTPVITVAAWKGGVGKTLLAYELAYLLDAVLVDLDWDAGGASVAWGYRHEARVTAPLLDALESGRVPRPLRGAYKPELIPCHPDFAENQPRPEQLATALEKWAGEWGTPVVVDTHPGGVPATYGALSASELVVVPCPMATRELAALEAMVAELRDYPLLIVPSMVPPVPPEQELKQLEKLSQTFGIPVGPAVSRHEWLRRRKRRMAITATTPVPLRTRPLVDELTEIAKVVAGRVRSTA